MSMQEGWVLVRHQMLLNKNIRCGAEINKPPTTFLSATSLADSTKRQLLKDAMACCAMPLGSITLDMMHAMR